METRGHFGAVLRWSSATVCAASAAMAFGPGGPPAQPGVARARVRLAGVPVGGRAEPEVARLARDLAARLLSLPLVLEFGRHREKTTPAALGAQVDVEQAVESVFDTSSGDTLLRRIRDRIQGPERRDVPLAVRVSEAAAGGALKRFAARIDLEPRDARLGLSGGRLKRIPSRPGRVLDLPALVARLDGALNAPELHDRLFGDAERAEEPASEPEPLVVAVPTREAAARIHVPALAPVTTRLATFSTTLAGSSRNRLHNIRLACAAIDGTALLPGDVFSYNDIVGPRVPGAGYREAPVIIRGRLQPGTGGGICQVSGTLYNAVLLADLEVVRRRHHAIPVSYLPSGRDATVVDGLIDFRFKNRLRDPVAVQARVEGMRLVADVWGSSRERRDVELIRSGLSRIPAGVTLVPDPKLPRGQRVVTHKAVEGRRVTVTRIVRRDGREVRREVISRDHYRPVPAVVRVGTSETPGPAAAPGSPKPAEPVEPRETVPVPDPVPGIP